MSVEKKPFTVNSTDDLKCTENKTSSTPESVIVDLDHIIEKYLKYWLSIEKPKKNLKLEDLEIDVNWKKVVISQDDCVFEKGTNVKEPSSVTLFKTQFTNRTSQIQQFSFKTERTTRQTCGFSFTKGFSTEKEASVSIKIPGK